MPEILIILTVVFIAYLVYNAVGDAKKSKSDSANVAAPVSVARTQATKATATQPAAKKPAPVKSTTKPTPAKPIAKAKQPEKAKTVKAKPAPTSAASAVKEIRNPETNEVSAVASNYRFIKRCIKDAMVTEGLLDKVYKTNELDDSNAEKIKDALNKIKALKKYQV